MIQLVDVAHLDMVDRCNYLFGFVFRLLSRLFFVSSVGYHNISASRLLLESSSTVCL
jgi:hypothetical protein